MTKSKQIQLMNVDYKISIWAEKTQHKSHHNKKNK